MRMPAMASANTAVIRRHKPWSVRSTGCSAPRALMHVGFTRRYEVTCLTDDGSVESFTRVAPAIPQFEAGFSAFAHGVMVPTTEGPVAVEDLVPGMGVETSTGEVAVLRWVGAMTVIPTGGAAGIPQHNLYRVTADALGYGGPTADVTFGPGARLMNRSPAVRAALGARGALAPIASFVDGVGVVALRPISAVRVYHLSFDRHHILRVGGVEAESFHPGPDAHYALSEELRAAFLQLFPHKQTLHDFGGLAAARYELSDEGFELI